MTESERCWEELMQARQQVAKAFHRYWNAKAVEQGDPPPFKDD